MICRIKERMVFYAAAALVIGLALIVLPVCVILRPFGLVIDWWLKKYHDIP